MSVCDVRDFNSFLFHSDIESLRIYVFSMAFDFSCIDV